jgi:hypothetical protein
VATIIIEVPDTDADIPKAMASLRAQMATVNAQRDALQGAMIAIQKRCKHPGMVIGRDIGGGRDCHCTICGHSE